MDFEMRFCSLEGDLNLEGNEMWPHNLVICTWDNLWPTQMNGDSLLWFKVAR